MADRIKTELLEDYQGQPTIRVAAPGATWFFHREGGGFASLLDDDGNDWIGYKPGGGSAGQYRGIPNLVFPDGIFHPGDRNCSSEVVERRDDRAVIESRSKDDRWLCRWTVTARMAHMRLLKAGGLYWFLYEGTPGGRMEYDRDFAILCTGQTRKLGERWTETLPAPAWVGFASTSCNRTLLVTCHDPVEHVDQYWPMEHNMTVMGFGRDDRGGLRSLLTHAPADFTVQLIDSTNFAAARTAVDETRRAVSAI